MSYEETKNGPLITITLIFDARRGKGVCGSEASITMADREKIGSFLFKLGWRLMRGHQVCGECLQHKRVSFPRKAKS